MKAVSAILLDLAEQSPDHHSLPGRLCTRAADALGTIDGAALALANDDRTLDLLAASDDSTRDLERRQLDLGEGPSLSAHHSGLTVHVTDLRAAAERWPVYAGAAEAAGVRGSVSIPLRVGGIRLGVLDLLARRAGHLEDEDLTRALDYAEAAVLVVLHLHSLEHHDGANGANGTGGLRATPSPLEQAFDARAEVHQATGMVSVQAGVDLTEALLLIRARAFSESRSMMDVALDVVDRTLRFE